MVDSTNLNRREWLKAIGAGATALALRNQTLAAEEPAPKLPPLDKNDPKTLAAIFDGITFTDQHGEKLDPAELLREGEAIVLFGYGGCPRCQEISKTVSAVQQKLIDKNKKVPVLVVSVQPEKDRGAMREYIARYHELGIRQFQPGKDADKKLPENKEDRRKAAETGFDAYDKKNEEGRKEEQAGRIFHIACPPKDEDSKTIQNRISEALKLAGSKKLLITSDKPKEHTAFVTIFSDGKAVETYRSLNDKLKAPREFADRRADEIIKKIMELEKSKGR